jgi:hypothetical protein
MYTIWQKFDHEGKNSEDDLLAVALTHIQVTGGTSRAHGVTVAVLTTLATAKITNAVHFGR